MDILTKMSTGNYVTIDDIDEYDMWEILWWYRTFENLRILLDLGRNYVIKRETKTWLNSFIVHFWCREEFSSVLSFCPCTQIHTGECADRPGGSSGVEDQRSREFSGGASAETQLHRGDATAGTQLYWPHFMLTRVKISYAWLCKCFMCYWIKVRKFWLSTSEFHGFYIILHPYCYSS